MRFSVGGAPGRLGRGAADWASRGAAAATAAVTAAAAAVCCSMLIYIYIYIYMGARGLEHPYRIKGVEWIAISFTFYFVYFQLLPVGFSSILNKN